MPESFFFSFDLMNSDNHGAVADGQVQRREDRRSKEDKRRDKNVDVEELMGRNWGKRQQETESGDLFRGAG